jgi:hypothetical protein
VPKYLAEEYSQVKVLALHAHNGGLIHTRGKLVRTMDDLKGLRIRTPSPAVSSMLEHLGATAPPCRCLRPGPWWCAPLSTRRQGPIRSSRASGRELAARGHRRASGLPPAHRPPGARGDRRGRERAVILLVTVVELGLITPPIGMNLFVLRVVADDLPLGIIIRGIPPFILADITRLAILIAVPALSLWLPARMR